MANFAMGCVLIFMFGAVVYSAVTLLPLYFQSMMDYSAWWSGLVVSPCGVGAILAMPLVGISVSKVDTRILVSIGFFVFSICSFIWSTLTLQISPWSLTWPIVISGFSLGMVFVPLSTRTLGDLKPEEVGNGSGLYNLMRNIGGSVGISVVETPLARRGQLHKQSWFGISRRRRRIISKASTHAPNFSLNSRITPQRNSRRSRKSARRSRNRRSSGRMWMTSATWRRRVSAACRWSGS